MDEDLGALQRKHWQDTYRRHPVMYGSEPSRAARYAAEVFAERSAGTVLELGAGHGRDALWLAGRDLRVHALDFSPTALDRLERDAAERGLADRVTARVHDAREELPLSDASVDGVFAHMLLCMALSTDRIRALAREVRRVLRPGGAFVYTVRHTGDAHHGTGVPHGDGIFEHGGFAVHFFDRALVEELALGWRLEEVHPFEEGDLPRRLWRVTMVRPA
ncbi:class I SAM-dependent methyltransferase [Nocardiopsis lambiniae]|uniref:Class I SAM-dependent methyltransferase n=1 Tax=Nocardiopsis lambiniae TaxID=3075539 RepID=A0ABU2M6D8_9ACTN|nr:class I SAM-dependent methyltransferase [Nocardiopsis sp. DSM 44743]MDT0328217.1 class I SAM-dependent methyltransferase [Nocardiopsis sp. DSM 44743]